VTDIPRDGAIIFGDLFGKLDASIRSPRDMTQWNQRPHHRPRQAGHSQ
jgi:hypothetical protein